MFERSDSCRGLGEKHRDIRAPGSAAGGRDRPRRSPHDRDRKRRPPERPPSGLYRTALRHSCGLRLIASGGVSSLEDLSRLQRVGCHAAVVGRALLSGEVSWPSGPPAQMMLRTTEKSAAPDLAVRIIPCLDVDRGRVVKGTSFQNLRDAGDPVELARRYCAEGADELVFLDITATSDQRETACDLAREVARAVNIPFTVGGGVRSVRDGRALLDAGADKVSVNTAALARLASFQRWQSFWEEPTLYVPSM